MQGPDTDAREHPLHLLTFGFQRTAGPYSSGHQRTWRLDRLTSALPQTANIAKCASDASQVPPKRKSDDLMITSPGPCFIDKTPPP
jgi:hypothetical protein